MLGRLILALALCQSAIAEKKEVVVEGTKILLETGKTSDAAAAEVVKSLTAVKNGFATLVQIDGNRYRGQWSLIIMKNMENDKREAVRDMVARFRRAVTKQLQRPVTMSLDEIFNEGRLRTGMQTVLDRAIEDMTKLHANRWYSDHHTRNRISFLGQFIARFEYLENLKVERREIDAKTHQDLVAAIPEIRAQLLKSAENLEKFKDAYLEDGHYAGSDHNQWFDDAKATLGGKSEVKLGVYSYSDGGDVIGYTPYEGEFQSLMLKAEPKKAEPKVIGPEELPSPKKPLPVPPKPNPPAAPTDEDLTT